MKTFSSLSITIALTAFLVACPQEKTTAPASGTAAQPTKPASGPAAPAAPTAPAAGGEAGARKMAHCPSTVEGAKTEISDAADAVVVTVTAQAEPATNEIRTRAKHLAEVSVKTPTDVKHTGEGEGGGGLGNCPVVLADTAITAEDVPGGSKLTVKPGKPADLDKLKATARERQAKMAAKPATP